jgi:calcineurin-like phosphoesterase family protein
MIEIEQILPLKSGGYQVYSKKTGWFLVKELKDLTKDMFDEQEGVHQILLDKSNEWEKEFREKLILLGDSYQKVWVTADLHIGHRGILNHSPERGYTEEQIEEHNKWIIDIWKNTVGKQDILYLVGDIIWWGKQSAEKLLHQLPRGKECYCILGNHDNGIRKSNNFFTVLTDLYQSRFKKEVYPYIESEFIVNFCHYPIVSWRDKPRWAVNIHGHCHGKICEYNDMSTDMRWDVGFDTKLGYHRFVPLEDLYCEFMKKKIIIKNFINNR